MRLHTKWIVYLVWLDDVVEESVAGRNFDGGVDALLALEVLDHQTVVRFSNLKLKFKLIMFCS